MATKKKAVKKVNLDLEKGIDGGIDKIKAAGENLMDKAKELKNKYNKMDNKTKKQIVAGIAGAAALVVGMKIAKRRCCRKSK